VVVDVGVRAADVDVPLPGYQAAFGEPLNGCR
jgi:hypothetical protein